MQAKTWTPEMTFGADFRFKPYHAVMAAVFVVSLAAGWVMLPGQGERIAMLERDGHSREALAMLEEAYSGGDRSYRTLHEMLALYEDEGKTGKTGEILAALVAQRPRDTALRDRQAKFLRSAGDGDALIGSLKAQIAVRYSEPACRELVTALRLKGDAKAEAEALQMCRQKSYRRPDDLIRLASLAAANGDTATAAQILRSIDDIKRLKENQERYQLVSLLLDQGQPREAERRAVRWIKAGKDQSLAVGLIDILARSKYPETAIDVAKDAGAAGDLISLTVSERLIDQAQPRAAQLYLRGWLDNAQFENVDVISRFVEAALAAQDPEVALAGARKWGLAKLPPVTAADLVRNLAAASLNKEAEEVLAAVPATAGTIVADQPTDADAPSSDDDTGKKASQRLRYVTVDQSDPLAAWRRSLSGRMSDDAAKRVVGGGRGGQSKVLKKTSKILQRTKKLTSLRLKQKQIRDKAKASKGH